MSSPFPEFTYDEWKKMVQKHLRDEFELDFEERVNRFCQVKIQRYMPGQFFCFALVECRDMFVAGHFYGCISLCQSASEGIAKFLIESNIAEFQAAKVSTKTEGGPYDLSNNLRRAGVISEDARKAFLRICGTDRNDFHHLNKEIETDEENLEQRAKECLDALNVIESEVFSYDIREGMLLPTTRKYWPVGPDGESAAIYFRSM